jgi:RNA polymerase sigma-70 factor (ECF subfamily)
MADAPSNEPESVAAIVREHADFVWRTLRFLGVRHADLDDACQEVFIVVLRKLESLEKRSSLKAWLRGICVKKAAAYRRRAHVQREVSVAEPAEERLASTPESHVTQREKLDLLERALETLSEEQRAVFVLYEIEGLPMKAVAEAVGCPLQTAYSRHRVAREQVAAFARKEEVSP